MTFTPSGPPSFAAIPKTVFGQAAQHLSGSPTPKVTKADRRYMRAAKTAAELLPDLPRPGESVHALMTGTFDLCQVITDVVGRIATLRHLRIATLCFSKRNSAELLALLETRPTLRLTLLVSAFFKGHNKELFERFAGDISEYADRARLAAARSHCKVVCLELGKRDAIVFEGPANLRTNKNREQLTVIRDRRLHDWHADWIDQLVKADEQAEEANAAEAQG